MKKLGLTFMVFMLLSSNGYSFVKDLPRFACTLNRSVELWFVERTESDVPRELRLVILKKVNAAKAVEVADLSRTSLLQYGNVWTALADNGRSGYALVRVQRNEDEKGNITGYTGHLDINLFLQDEVSTNGQLLETHCRFLQ